MYAGPTIPTRTAECMARGIQEQRFSAGKGDTVKYVIWIIEHKYGNAKEWVPCEMGNDEEWTKNRVARLNEQSVTKWRYRAMAYVREEL